MAEYASLPDPVRTGSLYRRAQQATEPRQHGVVRALGDGPADIVVPDSGTVYQLNGSTTFSLITVRGTSRCANGVNAEVEPTES